MLLEYSACAHSLSRVHGPRADEPPCARTQTPIGRPHYRGGVRAIGAVPHPSHPIAAPHARRCRGIAVPEGHKYAAASVFRVIACYSLRSADELDRVALEDNSDVR